MLKKIVVGIDFSTHSDRAIRAALDLAVPAGATVVLVNVVPALVEQGRAAVHSRDDSAHGDSTTPTLEQTLKAKAEDLRDRNPGALVDYGVVVGNDAADEIVKYVKTWGGDLIVVGSAGRRGLDRILAGSVTAEIVQSSPVPVLIAGPSAKKG
ncbi:MAG: universal stress protein [Polyangiales bacterium]